MFRYLVLLPFFLLLSIYSLAQNLAERPAGRSLNNVDQNGKISVDRSAVPIGARISIRRLKVSRKARQLYEKAYDSIPVSETCSSCRRVSMVRFIAVSG